jgi:hypothetical protein
MEVDQVVFGVKSDSHAVEITLRIGRFSSNQRNSVQESSIVGNRISDSSVFVVDSRSDGGFRQSKFVVFSLARGEFFLTRISGSEQVLFLEALPAVIQQPETVFIKVLRLFDGFDGALRRIQIGLVILFEFNIGQPIIDLSLFSFGSFLPVQEFLPVAKSSGSHALLPHSKVGIFGKVVLVVSVSLQAVGQSLLAFRVASFGVIPRNASRDHRNSKSGSDSDGLEDASDASGPARSVNGQSTVDGPELVVGSEDTIPDSGIGIDDNQTRGRQSQVFIDISDSLVKAFGNGLLLRKDLSGGNISLKFSFLVVRDNNRSAQKGQEFKTVNPRIVCFGDRC